MLGICSEVNRDCWMMLGKPVRGRERESVGGQEKRIPVNPCEMFCLSWFSFKESQENRIFQGGSSLKGYRLMESAKSGESHESSGTMCSASMPKRINTN